MRLAFLTLLIAGFPISAALDAETKVPYQLRVVVQIGEHPSLTPHFRSEFKKELRDQLQAALGSLARIEVIDVSTVQKENWEPLWKLVDEKGLQTLDTHNLVGGGKTHFLKLDFIDGQYEIQTRQHDGTSGFVTPIVRKVRLHDRDFIARQAGLLIGQDFGLVATLDPTGGTDRFYLKIKGSGIGDVQRWVKPGEVFAVNAIRQERRRDPLPPGSKGPAKSLTVQTGNRLDGVLLVATGPVEADGRVPVRMFHRYDDPLSARGAIGYRCVKLGTIEAPLRLQLVDAGGAILKQPSLAVYARTDTFPDGDRESDQTALKQGAFVSKDPISHAAMVRVMLGDRRVARIPVEILEDRVETRIIRLDPTAEARDRLEAERRGLSTRITDERLIQIRVFQEITALEQMDKKVEALDRGEVTLKLLEAASIELEEEIGKLKERAGKDLPNDPDFTADSARQLGILRGKQTELQRHLDDLKAAITADNDPTVVAKKKKIQDLLRAAELLVTQAEYDAALAKYEEALTETKDDAAARQRIETPYLSLKNAWSVKLGDAAHADARRFITETWPKLATLTEVRDLLPNARRAFEKSKAVGDRLGLNKMNAASVEVVTRFADELKKLSDAATEAEEKKTLQAYLKVNEDLLALLKDLQDSLVDGKK